MRYVDRHCVAHGESVDVSVNVWVTNATNACERDVDARRKRARRERDERERGRGRVDRPRDRARARRDRRATK